MKHRGKPVVFRIHPISKLPQRLKERGLRTLVHSRHSLQAVNSVSQTNQRREEPGCGAGIANEEFQRLLQRARVWDLAAQSLRRDRSIAELTWVGSHFNMETEPPQALDHDLRVFAPKRSFQAHLAVRERGQD